MHAAATLAPFASSKDWAFATHAARKAADDVRSQTQCAREAASTLAPSCCVAARVAVAPVEQSGDAVMLEPREMSRRPLVLLNFRAHLPANWPVHLMILEGVKRTQDALADFSPLLSTALLRGLLRVRALPRKHPAVALLANATRPHAAKDKYSRVRWYNLYLAAPDFWQRFHSRWLLLFEMDSALCSKPNWQLERFLEQPFIFWGAPWSRHSAAAGESRGKPGGNSGLSLWRRDVIAAVSPELEKFAWRWDDGGKNIWAIDGGLWPFFNQRSGAASPQAVHRAAQRAAPEAASVVQGRAIHATSAEEVEELGVVDGVQKSAAADGESMRPVLLNDSHAFLLKPPNQSIMMRFSVETLYRGSYAPVGVHNPFKVGPSYTTLLRLCPAALLSQDQFANHVNHSEAFSEASLNQVLRTVAGMDEACASDALAAHSRARGTHSHTSGRKHVGDDV